MTLTREVGLKYSPLLLFKVPDGSGEEPSCDKVEQTRREDEEQLHLGRGSGPARKV